MPEIEILMDSTMDSTMDSDYRIENEISCVSFYLNTELADIWLVCGEKRYPAHKVLIALKSDVLREKFKQNPNLSLLRLDGVGPEAVESFLRFVYHNTYVWDQNLSTALDLMTIAKHFEVFNLPLLVTEEIMASIENSNSFLTITNFGDILKFMEDNKLKRIQSKVILFGVQHIKGILEFEFMALAAPQKIQRVIAALKPTQSQIMEALSPDIIKLSNKKPEEFEVFIDLDKCSVKELIELSQRQMFSDHNLLDLAKNRSAIYENFFRGSD